MPGLELSPSEIAFFRETNPFGLFLFKRNLDNPAQIKRLVAQFKKAVGREDAPVYIDQEGGRVARMKPPVWQRYPAGDAFARLWDIAPASAIEAARRSSCSRARPETVTSIREHCLSNYSGAGK